jgi:nucleoside-triphosphatase THEP1
MSEELTIIIAGRANSGKSTMMLQLEKLLKENGYDVTLSLKGEPDYTGENSFHFHKKEELNFDKKVEAIKSKTKITLKEMQVNSETKHIEKDLRQAYTNC